jgi:hypothetical protein
MRGEAAMTPEQAAALPDKKASDRAAGDDVRIDGH